MVRAAIGLAIAAGTAMVVAVVAQPRAQAQDAGSSKVPSFVDERRLPDDAETAARRKAEAEAQRKAAEEAAAKQRAEQQERARQAAEAEAQRKTAEEAAAKQRAEQQERARQAAEAEAQRKAAEEAAAKQRAEQQERARQAAEAEAQRKAAEEAAAKQRAEQQERARQAAEAEAQRKAAEEAAAKQRAEQQERARQAAEAEAQRKAAEEAAAKQRAEQQERARQAAEAEAQRRAAAEAAARKRAEEQERARRAAEAEAQRKAAEQRRNAPADDLARRMAGNGACKDVKLESQLQPAGRIEIVLKSICLAGRNVSVAYAGHEFVRTVSGSGDMTFLLDLFEGKAPVTVKLDDGTTMPVDTAGIDFARVSKIAVLWTTPVNLDLHANEYLAKRGAPGHVWARAPGTLVAAVAAAREGNRGRGFMSMEDAGTGPGTHAEVYTFLHNDSQRSGAVTLLIDYETRGETPQGDYCGSGSLAEVEAQVVRLRPGGRVDRETVRLGAAPCGQRLSDDKRYNSDTLSDLVARR